MTEQHPVIPGAEPWSSPGSGDRAGSGAVIVHGFTGNPISTRPLGEALAARGFRVEVVRLPGHGTHWRDMLRTRYQDWYGEVDRAVDALRPECPAVFLVGLSMGGTIVLDVASRRPDDIAGVVSINAAVLDREGLVARLAPIIARLIPALPAAAANIVKNDTARDGVDEQAYGWVPMKAAQSVLAELPRIRSQLGGLAVPVLAVYSALDRSVPPDNTRAIPGLVGDGGHVDLLELARSRHLATLDLDRDELFDRVAAFMDQRSIDDEQSIR